MDREIDVKKFWEENEECMKSSGRNRKRIPMHYWLDDHFLIEEMKLPSTLRYYDDYSYRREINSLMNRRTDEGLGKKFFAEDEFEEPLPNRFEVILGSYWKLTEGGTPWLESTVESIEDVKKLNVRNAKIDMEKAAFPGDWNDKKAAFEKASGKKMSLGGNFSRGPATMATSILGTTNTCMFMMTDPEVMDEFFAILGDRLVEYHRALMKDTGNTTKAGYQFNDDNCYLFPPAQYEQYCAPVLRKVFSEFAPGPGHKRHQHSDSPMGHLMTILYDLGVNEANFGPTIHPQEIRKAMPDTVIYGQMPPFTLRNETEQEIIDLVRRDIDSVGGDGRLVECTAGSVAGGTSFENIRTYMWALDKYGRY